MRRSFLQKLSLLLLLTVLLLQQGALAVGEDGWPLSAVGWTDDYDGSGVRIGVIDTGISTKHLDGTHILSGKNYVFPEEGTDDLVGHGTCIAGILLGSESMGIAGVAPGAELVPLVYYSRYPTGVPANGGVEAICKAIYDAVDEYGCRIINLSSGISSDDGDLRKAAAYAEEKGVLIVSAVGNDNLTAPERFYYPAGYDTVVGVGTEGVDGRPAPTSQRNSSVLLLAPGAELPAVPSGSGKTPLTVSGSSYAAAYVTGAAARLLEKNAGLAPAQIREILSRTATDVGPAGYDADSGWGVLNLEDALAAGGRYLPFSDVDSGSWYYDAAFSLCEAGIFSGSGARFEPTAAMTRAMCAAVLYRLENRPEPPEAGPFRDVPEGMWYTDAADWAAGTGILAGSGGVFGAGEAMTREDLVLALYRYAQYKGYDVNTGGPDDLMRYADAQELSGDTRRVFEWACSSGILSGFSGALLAPGEEATRAQAAVMLLRFAEHFGA